MWEGPPSKIERGPHRAFWELLVGGYGFGGQAGSDDGLQKRHHGAQTGAELLDRVLLFGFMLGQEIEAPVVVFGDLVKYWTGRANANDGTVVRSNVTDRYIKMAKDTKFRPDVAERIGLGFEVRKAQTDEVVPSVPNSEKTEVVVSV
jgi:hypothetical protein